MTQFSPAELLAAIDELADGSRVVLPSDAEKRALRILRPLFEVEGYSLHAAQNPTLGFDFIGHRSKEGDRESVSVGIEYRHYTHGKHLSGTIVRQAIGSLSRAKTDRAMIVSLSGFSTSAREIARTLAPVAVELLDAKALQAWVARVASTEVKTSDKVEVLVRTLAHELAVLIARDPAALDLIEWRDFERAFAQIFRGLGYEAKLTPPSHDGGKDIILGCTISEGKKSFVVELKHWVAGDKVGKKVVNSFVNVVATEQRSGGLLVATSGFTGSAFESLTEVTRQTVKFGSRSKVLALAKRYERAAGGIWSAPNALADVLFEDTL